MANEVYNNFKRATLSGLINCSSATFKVMLTTSSYTLSQSHMFTGHITNEISSAGYSPGGLLIPNTTVLTDTVTNKVILSGANVTFSGITASPASAIVYVSGATLTTNYLVCKIDINGSPSNADYTINWNSTDGILNEL